MSLLTGGGGGTLRPKRSFGYDMHIKHELTHDVDSKIFKLKVNVYLIKNLIFKFILSSVMLKN